VAHRFTVSTPQPGQLMNGTPPALLPAGEHQQRKPPLLPGFEATPVVAQQLQIDREGPALISPFLGSPEAELGLPTGLRAEFQPAELLGGQGGMAPSSSWR